MLVFSLSVGVLVHGYVTNVNDLVDHKQACVGVLSMCRWVINSVDNAVLLDDRPLALVLGSQLCK